MKDELRVRWTPPVRRPDSDISFPPPSNTDSKISGYLNKQGARGPLKTWKKRWFIFDKETGELFYYISESTSQPLGVIDIDSCEVHRNHSGSKREFTIHYISTGRIYYLSATSEQEVSFWVTHFLEWKSLKGNSRSTPSRGATFTRSKTIFSSAAPPSPINFSLSRSSPQTSPPSPQSVLAISPRNGRLRRDETKERGLTIHEEDEDKKSELLDELSHRLLVDIQDVHSVRKLLTSFHRPLTAGDTQYISLQLIRQMEYLNLVLQEVSQYTSVKEEEKSEAIQDEYTEEAITGHFFMLPSGLAYYLFSFLEPADLSRACQVCRTWKTYAENPVLWAQFMATPSSKYDNQKNWKALYISTQQPKTKTMRRLSTQQVRAVSIYGMPPTSFGGSVKEGWLHKRNDDLLKTYKRRWFVIRENCLIYYKTPKDNLPCGVIPLADLSFALVKGTGRKHCFKLSNHALKEQGGHGKVEIVLSADSEEDCLSWVSELRNNMVMRKTPAMPNLSNLQSLTVPTDGRSRDISTLSRSVSSIAFTTPQEKLYPYFGVSLATLMAQQQQSGDDTKIPSVIDKAITYLTEKALDEEGLLRISGSLSEIQSMKMIIEQGKELDFTAHDPHAVTGLVKSFFRELPERLVPPDLNAYAATVAAEQTSIDGNTIVVNKQQKIDEFRFIIQSLPVHNHNLLRALIQFLLKVASHSDKNKMTENNVLRVIIPTIHCNPQLFAYCMQHFTALFNDGYL